MGTSVLTNGAGQIRAFGRLAFFHGYQQLRNSIRDKIEKFSGGAIDATKKLGFSDVDTNNTEIVIIASLAGGTGSGCFLDTAFLAKEISPNAIITGIFFLPDVFEGVGNIDSNTVSANGYAALEELEYYLDGDNAERGMFNFKWDGNSHPVPAPPFSTVYILSKKNMLHRKTDDYADVFQMTAESLMLDFDASSFSDSKRGRRSNMSQFLNTRTKYTVSDTTGEGTAYIDYFPNSYSSFGLSQIQLNQPRIANAAGYKLAQAIVRFWLKSGEVPRGFEFEDVRNILSQLGLDANGLRSKLLLDTTMDAYNLEIDNRFRPILDKINAKLRELSPSIENMEGKPIIPLDNLGIFCREIIVEFDRIANQVLNDVNNKLKNVGTTKGDDIKKLENNSGSLQKELDENFKLEMLGLLSDPVKKGVNYAVEFLKTSKEEIDKLKQNMNESIKGSVNDFSTKIEFEPTGTEEYNKYRSLRTESQSMPFFAFLMKRAAVDYFEDRLNNARENYLRNNINTFNKTLISKIEELKSYVRERYYREAYNRLVRPKDGILNRFDSQIGGKTEASNVDGTTKVEVTGFQKILQAFTESLGEFESYYKEMFESYENPSKSERNENIDFNISYLEEIIEELRKRYPEIGNTTDFDEVRNDVLSRVSSNFFLKSGLIADTVTRDGESTEENLVINGVRIIYDRAAQKDDNSRAWIDVRERLESFALQEMQHFKDNVSVLQLFRRTYQNATEQEKILRGRMELGCVRIEKSALPFAYEDIQYSAIIGVSDTNDLICGDVRRISSTDTYEKATPVFYSKDSLLFYSELTAFPAYYVGALDSMRAEYIKNFRRDLIKHPYHRHTDQDYRKFQDILPPSSTDEAYTRTENYRLLIESLILGNVEYQPKSEQFLLLVKRMGMVNQILIGKVIPDAVDFLSFNEELANHLKERNSLLTEEWLMDDEINKEKSKWYQLLMIINYIDQNVFPGSHTTMLPVLNQEVQVLNLNKVVLDIMRTEKWMYIKNLAGDLKDNEMEKRLNEQGNIDDFSTEIDYMEKGMKAKLRRFKST
jgi:hypothetical protein